MSSQQNENIALNGSSPKTKASEIDQISVLSDHITKLCMSDDYADITFLVEGDRIPAHRIILVARCEYFRAMFHGEWAESKQTEILMKVPLQAFQSLLRYIYSGHMSLSRMKEEHILDILGLANQYCMNELRMAISEYLRQVLSLDNVCGILDAARLYDLETLTNVCYAFIDRRAADVIAHQTFKMLSQDTLIGLLERDSFFAPEAIIFMGVHEWAKYNPTGNIESVVSHIRLPLMRLDQLFEIVRPAGILDPEKLLDAIEEKTTSECLRYRGALLPNENIALVEYGSKTVLGEMRSAILDPSESYDLEKGYTRHSIVDVADQGIIIELGTISIINHIEILLWAKDSRSYSYYIDVSVNQKQWERVIDHSQHYCRSRQHLYFEPRAVRYIKLVGTHNTVNKVFHVVVLKAMYSDTIPTLVNGIIEPTENVATSDRAVVIEGVSRRRDTLLDGDVKNYDWDHGYTCHQLGSGNIIIQLAQPYYISSLRLLLWDCDDRTYCYYIETSTNQTNWEMAVDKRSEDCRSWQHLTFERRVVVFIKIVGTYNTANEIFHCVHFECPAQITDDTDAKSDKSIKSA